MLEPMAGSLNKCNLAKSIENGTSFLPPPCCFPYWSDTVPFFLVGDDAFALKTYMMKPYSMAGLTDKRRIYN